MRLLERVDEAVVVETFLRGELASERFSAELRDSLDAVGASESLITRADLSDSAENVLRRTVLDAYRRSCYGDVFGGLAWFRAALDPTEVFAVRYIAWDYWLELTSGTRSPSDGAARLRAEGNVDWYGDIPGPLPLIVVRADAAAHLVVLEGHVRLTAFALYPERLPAELEVLLGEGESVRRWSLY